MSPRFGGRREPSHAPHQRPPDPQEAANRPLEPKARPGVERDPDDESSPYSPLNNPVGEPDPTSDADPYDPEADAGDPPPPGKYPGPGPEPEDGVDETG